MKKIFLIFLCITVVLMMAANMSEAGVYGAQYPNLDELVIYSSSNWDYWNHLVITYNNQDYSASATVLDPNGVPSSAYGYYYYWADFYSDHFDFYGSMNGVNWTFLGSYY